MRDNADQRETLAAGVTVPGRPVDTVPGDWHRVDGAVPVRMEEVRDRQQEPYHRERGEDRNGGRAPHCQRARGAWPHGT
jgi:hypothetical protein